MATTPAIKFGDPAAIAWHRHITEAMRGERAFATLLDYLDEDLSLVHYYKCPLCQSCHHIYNFSIWACSRRPITQPDCQPDLRPISLTLREGHLWVLYPENPAGEAR